VCSTKRSPGLAWRPLALCVLPGVFAPLPPGARAASAGSGVVIYAADDQGDVFASQDGGTTWQGERPAKDADIRALAVSPMHADTTYVLARGQAGSQATALYGTQDAGGHRQGFCQDSARTVA